MAVNIFKNTHDRNDLVYHMKLISVSALVPLFSNALLPKGLKVGDPKLNLWLA